jgi:hypothetical protein
VVPIALPADIANHKCVGTSFVIIGPMVVDENFSTFVFNIIKMLRFCQTPFLRVTGLKFIG